MQPDLLQAGRTEAGLLRHRFVEIIDRNQVAAGEDVLLDEIDRIGGTGRNAGH